MEKMRMTTSAFDHRKGLCGSFRLNLNINVCPITLTFNTGNIIVECIIFAKKTSSRKIGSMSKTVHFIIMVNIRELTIMNGSVIEMPVPM